MPGVPSSGVLSITADEIQKPLVFDMNQSDLTKTGPTTQHAVVPYCSAETLDCLNKSCLAMGWGQSVLFEGSTSNMWAHHLKVCTCNCHSPCLLHLSGKLLACTNHCTAGMALQASASTDDQQAAQILVAEVSYDIPYRI